MGENFDNQLGFDSTMISYLKKLKKVEGIPLMGKIFVGRNTVLCVSLENKEVYCWGSNKYGQLALKSFEISSLPKGTGVILSEGDNLVPSSYTTLFLTSDVVKIQ